MCANYLPIRPEHAHLLDLPQMTFDYLIGVRSLLLQNNSLNGAVPYLVWFRFGQRI